MRRDDDDTMDESWGTFVLRVKMMNERTCVLPQLAGGIVVSFLFAGNALDTNQKTGGFGLMEMLLVDGGGGDYESEG